VSAHLLAASTVERIATPQVSWRALLPIVVLLVGGILLLTIASLTRKSANTRWYAPYTVVTALIAAATAVPLWARVQGWDKLLWVDLLAHPKGPFSTVGGAIGIDGFGLFITFVICAAVVLGALLAGSYLRREGLNGPEFFALLLISAAGGVILAEANDFIVLFLGLETLSISVYILAAMHLRRVQSQEAGIKYFVLGAFSSAFLLYGIALVYGGTGTTSFQGIRNFFGATVGAAGPTPGNVPQHGGLILIGLALLLVGLGFKVAAVPFHTWSPDVYDGSPTPAVAYMAGAVKAAAFAALVRVFVVTFPNYVSNWRPIVWVLATLSLLGGAVIAIVQTNVKRTLAYSSINHAGFILIALSAASAAGNSAVLFYVAAYTFMVAGSFAVVGVIAGKGDGRTTLDDYRGLFHTNPGLTMALTVFLLSQAGIPFTVGFFAKFSAVGAVVAVHTYWLAVVAMLSAAISAFLYLRIVATTYLGPADETPARPHLIVAPGAKVAIGLCLLVTVGVGIVPGVFLSPAEQAKPVLVEPPAPTPPPAGRTTSSSGAGTTPSPTPGGPSSTGGSTPESTSATTPP
jgi:NADH-quinone oxidoreductase subunit N